jgi:hypothetical protein
MTARAASSSDWRAWRRRAAISKAAPYRINNSPCPAGCVVGVDAGADDRGVTHTARRLAGHPARRSGGGKIAVPVEGNGANRPGLDRLAPLFVEVTLQFPYALAGTEIVEFGERNTFPSAEGQCPVADQQHMGRSLHHRAGRQYRVARPQHARDRARPAIPSVHHRSIHFLRSESREYAPAAGIEQGIVLEHDDRFGHRIEGAATGREKAAAGRQGSAQALMI